MLPHPTYDRLIALGLVGMAKAFEEQRQQPAGASLTFEERLGLLVDREAVERESRRLVTRLKFANLRQNATIEDLNTKAARVSTRRCSPSSTPLFCASLNCHSTVFTVDRPGGRAGTFCLFLQLG